MASSEYSPVVEDTVEGNAAELWELSASLWSHPELALHEKKAHDLLTGFLEKRGFKIQRSYHLDTAFRAEAIAPGGTDGPTVALMAEYDALPDIGHGCGHNLIAEASVGAAIAVMDAMKKFSKVRGKLVVMGTPGEEGAGGKVLLLEKGAFQDIDAALMAHPASRDVLKAYFNSRRQLDVQYEAKAAHASDSPWVGPNAQDAAVAAYVNLSLLRQHIAPASRILGFVKELGSHVNVVPQSSKLVYQLRAPNQEERISLVKRARSAFEAAALATGCQVTMERGMEYKELVHNDTLLQTYRKHAEALGVSFVDVTKNIVARTGSSTDAGSVSYALPTLHPLFAVTKVRPHSRSFTESAGAEGAQKATRRTAKALALTALDLMSDPTLMAQVRKDFETWKNAQAPSVQ